MKTKQVEKILPPSSPNMVGDGFRVHNFFPHGYTINYDRMSPFFLLDYNSKIEFGPSSEPRGVGVHPHRGFETVTIAYHGKIAHHDSHGNHGIIGEGDIQWMTAASGILHKEYHEAGFSKKGGLFQMVQLWINLPAKYKMIVPGYQAIPNDKIAKYHLPNNKGVVEVIAGKFNEIKGNAHTFTPIEMYNIRLKENTSLRFSLPEQYNTGILVIEGSVRINKKDTAPTDNFVLFRNDGEEIELETSEACTLLLLSGEPIHEPVVAYGPFVMNSKKEILDAYNDLNTGKFGYLE